MQDWQDALARLKEGNERFVFTRQSHPRQDGARRAEILEGQRPFAVVLACSDSRVSPEIIFDQGLGDLFVIRVAGNILDDAVIASMEYAALHLGTQLIVPLGHTSCGAITVAVAGGEPQGHLGSIFAALAPALAAAGDDRANRVNAAARANVELIAAELRDSVSLLAARVAAGELVIMPAFHDMASGRVEFLTGA